MADQEEMIKNIIRMVRDDPSLWPTDYSKNESENYLAIIEQLIAPSLNSSGITISENDFQKAKEWAKQVMDVYIQKNPFQGVFVRPYAVQLFETLDKIWKKRSSQNSNGSWL